jgi:hypothetical protein
VLLNSVIAEQKNMCDLFTVPSFVEEKDGFDTITHALVALEPMSTLHLKKAGSKMLA